MIVEINFLEKKQKRKVAPYVISFLFILCLSLVITGIFLQGNILNREVSVNRDRANQLEASILEYQESSSDQRNLQQLQHTVNEIVGNTLPTVSLYQNVLQSLEKEEQLVYFQQNSQQQFMLESRFEDLNAVTAFVTVLLERSYVTDVHLNSVNQVEKGYLANVTVTFEEAEVKKELSINE